MSRDRISPESIDIALDHDITDTDHRILNPGRQPLSDCLQQNILVEKRFTTKYSSFPRVQRAKQPFQVQAHGLILLPAHPHQTQHHTQPLGDHRGHRRAACTPVEHRHKKQIQRHVHQRGKDQIIQRMQTVSQRLHDGHADVIENYSRHAGKINAEIQQ